MRRLALLVVSCVLVSSIAHAQPIPLSILGVGPVYGIKSVELDGEPGREFLVATTNPLGNIWTVVYPQNPDGLCTSLPFALANDQIDDFDGDGLDEIMHIDLGAQTVTFLPLPACR